MPDTQHAVTVKMPIFWPQNVEVWFLHVDAQFHLRHVTEQLTKYYHLVSALPADVCARMSDIMSAIPTTDPYDKLRQRVIQLHSQTDYQRIESMILYPALGDGNPSALLDNLIQICPSSMVKTPFLHYSFLSRLPPDIRTHLIPENYSSSQELGMEADRLWTLGRSRPSISAVTEHCSDTEPTHTCCAARTPDRNYKNRKPKPPPNGWCFNHAKWGNQTMKCVPPCTWKPAGNHTAGGGR